MKQFKPHLKKNKACDSAHYRVFSLEGNLLLYANPSAEVLESLPFTFLEQRLSELFPTA